MSDMNEIEEALNGSAETMQFAAEVIIKNVETIKQLRERIEELEAQAPGQRYYDIVREIEQNTEEAYARGYNDAITEAIATLEQL